MVMPLGPVKFYGSGLPRPFIYSDVKFNSERVDPPMGVTAPFMAWANDAHWSMGGVCLKRKRLQGKIEGSVKRLREEDEKETRIKNRDEKKKKEEEKKNKKRKTDKDAPEKGDLTSGSPTTDKDAPEKGDLASGSPKNKGTLGSKSQGLSSRDLASGSPKNKGTLGSKNQGLSSPKSPSAASPMDSPIGRRLNESRLYKRKWSVEDEDEEGDLPLVVPESKEKPNKKRSPRVRIRVRKLGDVFNQHANDGSDAPDVQGIESHKVPSVVMQATKRQAGKIMGVYDYVAVPDRVMKVNPKRASPRKHLAESPSFKVPSLVDSVRRSSRLSLTPSAGSR